MVGLNFGVVVLAVILGWIYIFIRIVLCHVFNYQLYSLPIRYYVILYLLTIYLLFIIIGIFRRQI